MYKTGLLVITLIVLVANLPLVCLSKEIVKGPNPGPEPIKPSNNLRSRFPINFQKNQEHPPPSSQRTNSNTQSDVQQKSTPAGVKILEALSASKNGPNILKRNPSPHHSNSNTNSESINQNALQRRNSEDFESGSEESDEFEDDNILSHRSGSYSYNNNNNNNNNNGPNPVFPNNTPRPTAPSGYGYNNNKPNMIMYKPGQVTPPAIIFPPVTNPSPVGPMSTSAPIGPPAPPSATLVPIIGGSGGSGGGGGGEDGEDGGLPPAPPEDIFPPSPPEIENNFVGRSLPLRSNPPRTRISPVGSSSREKLRSSSIIPTTTNTNSGGSGGSGGIGGGGRGGNGGGRVRVRLRDKVRESMESISTKNNNNIEPALPSADDPDVITDFVFSDIKCFKTRTKEYFGTTIHMKSGYHPPYVRDRPQDPLTSNDCRMEIVPGSADTFHMTVTDLRGCGVEQCGDYMCLTMVFPRVPTLALADDEVTTIKCLPQKSSMSDTRTISFAGDSLENRRSSSTVEGGGQEFAAEVGVFRQNPGSTNGLFVKRVNSGGVVQLGEPLQLRSIIRGGDGWKYSRLSDVKVWRMRDVPSKSLENLDPNDASEVITLVDGQGCRNDEYVVIADNHPLKDPRNDLINHFTFKAFLFRGQRANEPLILTAKVHACQEDLDCIPKDCDTSSHRRKKRSPVEIKNSSSIIHDWDSRMALRVVGLKDHSASLTEEDFPSEYSSGSQSRSFSDTPMTCAEKMAAAGLGGGLIVLLLSGISLALYAYIVKGNSARTKASAFANTFLENGHNSQATNRRHPTIQRGQSLGFHGETIRRTMGTNKPLPPPPPPSATTTNGCVEKDKLSKSEISNVAKILQKIADNNNTSHDNHNVMEEQTDYECIDESSDVSSRSSLADDNNNGSPSKGKKSDGVYIVYIDKNKSKRPKSAPPSLRGKKGSKKSRKKASEVYTDPIDSISESQTEVTEESDDDSSDANNNNNGNTKSSSRRTVRNVKNRSSHHHNNNNNSRHKVVSGIRRRLSSFYKDGKMQQLKNNFGSNKGGSFPSRQKGLHSTSTTPNSVRSSRSRGRISREELSDGIYSSTQLSSDLDSAYYGSEFNDDILHEMRQLATQHQHNNSSSSKSFGAGSGGRQLRFNTNTNYPYHQDQQNQNNKKLLSNVQMQLRNSSSGGNVSVPSSTSSSVSLVNSGLPSPPLEPGQTKAAHFVTRNDSSTQILIVPETHV